MTTVVLEAVGIGYLDSGNPTSVPNARTNYFPTGEFGGSQCNRAWLMFDLFHVPPDAVVSAASLDLTVDSNFLGTDHVINAYRLKRRCWLGKEDSSGATAGYPNAAASWNNYKQVAGLAWGTAGASNTTSDRDGSSAGSLAVTSATTGTKTIVLSTSQIQEWLDGTFANNGLLLEASVETASSNTLIRWKNIDAATASERPRLSITYTSATEALTLTDGVVAHYRLDDTADSSGNGHTLTNTNSATFVSGKVGNAGHFVAASTQFLSNNDAALKPGANDSWTVAGWVKLTDLDDFYTVASQWSDDAGGSGWRLFYHNQAFLDYFVAQFNGDAGDPDVADVIGFSSGAIGSAGTYIMFCLRHDAVRKVLHLGFNDQMSKANSAAGFSAGENWGPYTATYLPASSPFRIGARNATGATEPMNGDIDALTVWGRFVTDAQLTDYWAGGSGMELSFGAAGQPRMRRAGGVPGMVPGGLRLGRSW